VDLFARIRRDARVEARHAQARAPRMAWAGTRCGGRCCPRSRTAEEGLRIASRRSSALQELIDGMLRGGPTALAQASHGDADLEPARRRTRRRRRLSLRAGLRPSPSLADRRRSRRPCVGGDRAAGARAGRGGRGRFRGVLDRSRRGADEGLHVRLPDVALGEGDPPGLSDAVAGSVPRGHVTRSRNSAVSRRCRSNTTTSVRR
jgi:hypothetical protein